MAQQTVNVGTRANSGGGDSLRNAMVKINENFDELYEKVGFIGGLDDGQIVTDVTGSIFADDSTLLVDAVNGSIPAANLTGALPAIDGSALTGITVASVAFSNVTSTPTTIAGYGITDAFDAQYSSLINTPNTLDGFGITDAAPINGPFVGDLVGSVYADDSTLMIDGQNGTILAPVSGDVVGNVTGNVTGNLTGNVDGDVKGSVFADDSTLLVDGVNGKILSANLQGALPTIEGDNITVNGSSIQSTINTISAALAIGLS